METQKNNWLSLAIILLLVITCIFFAVKWLNLRQSKLDKENKTLTNQVDSLQMYRDSLKDARLVYDLKLP